MAADSGLPPVSALGSYKGVMLCNRPPESGTVGGSMRAGAGQPPFKSASGAMEPWGLPPPKKSADDERDRSDMYTKMRGPSEALRRHVKWIKELQQQVKEDHRQTEQEGATHEERRRRMATVFKKQRDAIQRIKQESQNRDLEPADVEAILRPEAKAKSKGGQKPLWALTEAERQNVEDDDAALLIQFAQDLDFDKYMDDYEFVKCLKVVRDRAKHLQREQDAFKDAIVREFNEDVQDEELEPDSASHCGSAARLARRRAGGGCGENRPDWDGSSTCDDLRPADKLAKNIASQALEENAQLRALHSKGSIQKMVEKVQSAAASDCGAN